jgi:DNA-binding response OmpR family regulator
VEVLARVRSQLRRFMQLGGNVNKQSLVIGNIELNDSAKMVSVDGENVTLTPLEFEILKLLMQNEGIVLSPKEIYRKVWQEECIGAESTVAVHIRHLREKVEINPAEPRYLKVVWAHGYKIEKGV